jgi:hypothetical protein
MKIKRNLLILLTTIPTIFFFTGCDSEPVQVNVKNNENISGTMFGKSAMIEIGDGLYYDSTTRIVYWWNDSLSDGGQSSTTPSPYYAPNGFPYRYNPETNTFEEIGIDTY